MKNKLKEKLEGGEVAVGSFVTVASARLTKFIGLIGFDFIVIDMEHGPIDITVAEDMVRGAETAGVTSILRVTSNSPHLIIRALDIGAEGLHIPNINTESDATNAVQSCKYAPQGKRGMAGVRALGYGMRGSLAERAVEANRETMVIAHIEDIEAVRNLDSLLAIEGIDVYYVGPVDLSNSMGIPGQTNNPEVVSHVEESIKRIVAAGKTAGCVAGDVASARRYVELGALYIASAALNLMVSGSKKFIEDVKS
jgi:4-hydroxy-2-oxoheptanedioate aldolase